MSARTASILKRVQVAVMAVLIVWAAVHSIFVGLWGWTAWRLGGFGMYSQPGNRYRGASIVVCGGAPCADELAAVRRFMPRAANSLPVFRKRVATDRYEVIFDSHPGGEQFHALSSFLRMPSRRYAEGVVRARINAPCGPYLVTHYTQHLSMLSRETTVTTRPFVVWMEESC